MAPRKKASGRARGKETATRKGVERKSSRGSRKESARSNGRRAARKSSRTRGRVASAPAPQLALTEDLPRLVFEALTEILAPYMNQFEADMHPSMGYCLKARGEGPDKVLFAGVQWSGEKLHFHLFPLQHHVDLRDQIGPDLRARLDGAWSFGFEEVEPELFAQLAELTAMAFERLRSEGLAPPLPAA
jgi:hypothetical protein